MSPYYLVRFQPEIDHEMDVETLGRIDALAMDLLGEQREWRQFVFRKLVFRGYGTPVAYFDISRLFIETLPRERTLGEKDNRMLDSLHDLIFGSEGELTVKKRLGTLLERYHYQRKRSEGLGRVFHNSSVYIQERRFEHEGWKKIDVGVDGLATRDLFVLAECTTIYGSFDAHKKIQLELYDKILARVRELLGGRTHLKFEMVVGYADPRQFRTRPKSQSMKKSNVQVIGFVVADDRTELVD